MRDDVQRTIAGEGAGLAFLDEDSRGGLAPLPLENSFSMIRAAAHQPVTNRWIDSSPIWQAEPLSQPGPALFVHFRRIIALEPKPFH